jgi:DMSO/TMAO reductase YedYZ molybdopterin-dependent catalytic subunit
MASKSPSRNNRILDGALLGAFATLALVGVLSLGNALFNFAFVPFDVFDWMARVLPGFIIGTVISGMVAIISVLQGFLPIGDISTTAKLAEQTIAVVQFIALGALVGAVLSWFADRRSITLYGQVAGLMLAGFALIVANSLGSTQTTGLGSLWLLLVCLAWGWGLAWLVTRKPAAESQEELSRRQFLAVSGAGLTAAALGAWGLSKIFGAGSLPASAQATPAPVSGDDPFGASLTSGPAASPSPAELAARTAPVSGTRPELTANDNFYRIDINTRPPEVSSDDWRLNIFGRVDNELTFTLDELRNMRSQTQILTMQCISNPIGGDLTSSSRWTGVPFKDILELCGVQDRTEGAEIRSSDGFYEFVMLEDLLDERCMLVYAMNDEPLPPEHGYPLRIYIPNRYGMKQPKWIETIEFMAVWQPGYWVDRGWDRLAMVNTVSVVDTVMVDQEQGLALTGGIAFASGRGISKVEVRVDESDWQQAELINPPLSPLNWVLWKYSWPYEAGRHTVSVRAYDGTGELQVTEDRPTAPSGATGIHSATVTI